MVPRELDGRNRAVADISCRAAADVRFWEDSGQAVIGQESS